MKLLSKEELKKLTTKRLLAYRNAIYKVPETPDWDGGMVSNPEDSQLNKTDPEWQETIRNVKEILDTRENV